MASERDDIVELHPHFRRVERELDEVPEWIKDAAAQSGGIADILVNHPEAKCVVSQNLANYVARILLKEPVYVVALPRRGIMSIGLYPEADSGTNLPICCQNRDIIIHTALQVDGDSVWMYTGKNSPNVLEQVTNYQSTLGSSEQKQETILRSNPILSFFSDMGFDVWTGEGWDFLKERKVDLSQHKGYGIFDSVPYTEFDRKIDMLRDFCRVNGYFGFVSPPVREHPEPDFRRPRIYNL